MANSAVRWPLSNFPISVLSIEQQEKNALIFKNRHITGNSQYA